MASDAEPAKLLLPYLQRADELQKHEPLVAYYCRLYAMERGMKIPQKERTKTTNALLVSLMNQLEKDKKSIKLGPEDNLYVEGFASNVFKKADKQDRAGRADLSTAKTFYAASIFFEILNQFGELQPDIEQKQKYAVWKAAEIRKALKEGRRPEPGPPGGEEDLSFSTGSPSSSGQLDVGQSQSAHVSNEDALSPQVDMDMQRSGSFKTSNSETDKLSPHEERINPHVPPEIHTSPPHYSSNDYPSAHFHHHPSVDRSESSSYPQTHIHQHQSLPHNYYSQESSGASFSYPNFQSFPSFTETSFPSVPTESVYRQQPAYYQGQDSPYSNQPVPSVSSYPSSMHEASNRNGNYSQPPPPASSDTYDSNYQPSVEKISDAHKAARFAVGSLAFDDVPTAVDFLRRALDLLTNPSAETH